MHPFTYYHICLQVYSGSTCERTFQSFKELCRIAAKLSTHNDNRKKGTLKCATYQSIGRYGHWLQTVAIVQHAEKEHWTSSQCLTSDSDGLTCLSTHIIKGASFPISNKGLHKEEGMEAQQIVLYTEHLHLLYSVQSLCRTLHSMLGVISAVDVPHWAHSASNQFQKGVNNCNVH